MTARTIFIGDLHACHDELNDLLEKVAYCRGDRVVSVGDVIVRGPEPQKTVALLRSIGAVAVRGNHEDRVLRYLDSLAGIGRTQASEQTKAAAHALTEDDVTWLRSLPLWLDFPDHRVRVVHAGVLPDVPIEKQAPEVLMTIRCIGKNGRPVAKREGPVWGRLYSGPPHVVFGHNARPEPQIWASATGIDTGCVYGGHLTAMVLPNGQLPPPKSERLNVLVGVRARRVYMPVRSP